MLRDMGVIRLPDLPDSRRAGRCWPEDMHGLRLCDGVFGYDTGSSAAIVNTCIPEAWPVQGSNPLLC